MISFAAVSDEYKVHYIHLPFFSIHFVCRPLGNHGQEWACHWMNAGS